MKKLIFVFILISFGFSFAGWIHYFPQVIYGLNTDRFTDKICIHKITTVGDDIIIAFAKGTGPLYERKTFTRLVRMDKHGRITDDVIFGYYGPDRTVYINPMGLERGLRSYLELYFSRGTITSSTWKTGVLYLDSSLTVIDELIFDYRVSYLYNGICRVDSSYLIGGIVNGRINFDGDTIWHRSLRHIFPDHYSKDIAVSPDKKFAFVCGAEERPDYYVDIITKVAKIDLDSGTVLWATTGLGVHWVYNLNKNYFALYPTPDGGLFHFSRSTGRHSVYYYYPSSGDEYRVQPEPDYENFRFWCFTPIDSNLFWAGGAFKYGHDLAAIAKVRLEIGHYTVNFRFIYMKTFPIRGFVEKIIPFDDSLIIAGIADAYVGEYSNYYFVMKTDTLGNIGISENHFPLPPSPKIAVCPNPFNKACRITLPDDDRWRVKVFDLSGRLVHDFGEISGKSVLWSPSDDVNSGVYVIIAEGRGEQISGKVVYLK